MRVLIAGCGDLGGRLGRHLVRGGHRVWGLRRNVLRLPAELTPLQGDLAAGALPDLPEVDAVVYSAAAEGFSDEAYERAYVLGIRHLLAGLTALPERWIHVGSTSVYAQSDGSDVDETSPAEPGHFGGVRLLEGEALLRAAAAGGGMRTVVVRFGGIYGPGRTRLLESVRQGSARCLEPQTWTNRIHIDDCVGVLAHLLQLESPAPLYLGVDCEPALDGDVKRWLARRLDLPDPVSSRQLGSKQGSNKRCSNRRLLASGYEFCYPDFRAGYGALLSMTEP